MFGLALRLVRDRHLAEEATQEAYLRILRSLLSLKNPERVDSWVLRVTANVVRDMFAGVRDFVGGRSGAYEKVIRAAKDAAIEDMQASAEELGANAIVGVDLDYEVVGDKGSMMMVVASGTAVRIG